MISLMAAQVKKLYELGIVDAPFIGLDFTPDCALGVHSASNQHDERRYEFYWDNKSHVPVDCISGLPLYELTTPANVMDSTVAAQILSAANRVLSLQECSFLADKGYDARSIYKGRKESHHGQPCLRSGSCHAQGWQNHGQWPHPPEILPPFSAV
jgi:hypothetical protein